MPRVMEKVVPVKIMSDELNCYASIQRSCITGITALLRLEKGKEISKGKHLNPQLQKMRELKAWAQSQYDNCVDRMAAGE